MANIVNQIFGILIFLTIPNILSPNDYSQTVYISVLLSFIIISNFGMNFVYSRIMPSVYEQNNLNKIEEYNQTFFWFGFTMSLFGSIIIASIYFLKYGSVLNAIVLIFLDPVVKIVTFLIQMYTVQEDFLVYRNLNIKNSFLKLLIIPMAYLFGVGGWVGGKIIASLLIIHMSNKNFFLKKDKINLFLIKKYFSEGLILLANFFFWTQLLNSGRLFAVSEGNDEIIAQYGMTNAGYILLMGFSISIFLPVTVASLKIITVDTKGAIEQLFNVIIKTSLPLFIMTVVAIELSPYLYVWFFPKYIIDYNILKYQLLSLMTLPIYATLGNIFLGTKQPMKLLSIYIFSFMIAYGSFYIFSNKYGIVSAAFAQFIGTTCMGTLLLIATFFFFRTEINNKIVKFFKLITIIFVPYIIYILAGIL